VGGPSIDFYDAGQQRTGYIRHGLQLSPMIAVEPIVYTLSPFFFSLCFKYSSIKYSVDEMHSFHLRTLNREKRLDTVTITKTK
jgi:hypothetical protein